MFQEKDDCRLCFSVFFLIYVNASVLNIGNKELSVRIYHRVMTLDLRL